MIRRVAAAALRGIAWASAGLSLLFTILSVKAEDRANALRWNRWS